jgi:hypothetical protein
MHTSFGQLVLISDLDARKYVREKGEKRALHDGVPVLNT